MLPETVMTLEQWNKYVEDSNEKFLAAPLAEKRVMLAEDTLKQLKSRRIVPMSMYLLFDAEHDDMWSDKELRDVLKVEQSCYVCGIGALFISTVQRLDKLSSGAFFSAGDPQHAIHNYMGEHGLFDRDELNIIESFFENVHTRLDRTRHMEIVMRAIIDSKGAHIDEPFRKRLYDEADKIAEEQRAALFGLSIARKESSVES